MPFSSDQFKFSFFLKNKGVELTPLLWLDAIHGKNSELIHLLEENHVEQVSVEVKSYNGYTRESIKCHHNKIIDYFLKNNIQNKKKLKIIILSFEI